MTKLKPSRQRHQVKSRWYYLFWGAATVSVFAGQIYVGNGFRKMAESGNIISADINLLVETLLFRSEPRGRYEPLVPPPGIIYKEDMVVK
tara:strand:- start:4637 stop:4906 length:270 start_codon:yes stop_codon:yes gene_type:complete